MPNQRTQDQLLALFLDNDDGDISAGDGRDFIATAFGHAAPGDPTPQNDKADTAGIGQFFDRGNFWMNTSTQVVWRCWSGAVNMAVWQPEWNGAPPPPPSEWFIARITSSVLDVTALKQTGIAGHTNTGSFDIDGIAAADGQKCGIGYKVTTSGNFAVADQFIFDVFSALTSIRVYNKATATGPITFDLTPLAVEWVEQTWDNTTGGLYPKPGGRVGTVTTKPAFNLEPYATDVIGAYVFIRKRGTIGGLELFEFARLPDPTGNLTVGNSVNNTSWSFSGGSSTTTTINMDAFAVFASLNVLVGTVITPLLVGGFINVDLLPCPCAEEVVNAHGTTQATATQLTGSSCRVALTIPGVQDGVILPSREAAVVSLVIDAFAGGNVKVYPPTGEYFNGFGLNIPVVLNGGQSVMFIRLPIDAGGQSEWRRINEL